MALMPPSTYGPTSGKMGSIVFSHNRYGQYCRARVVPTNPNTGLQATIRSLFGQLATAWVVFLTDAQRLGWTAWGAAVPRINRIGSVIFLAGNAAYQGANTLRQQMGLSRVDDAPVINTLSTLTEPGTLTLAGGASTLVITGLNTSDEWQASADAGLGVFISPNQNPSVNFYKGPFQFAGRVGGTATLAAATITLGSPNAAGLKRFVRLAATAADGRPSQEIIQGVLIV